MHVHRSIYLSMVQHVQKEAVRCRDETANHLVKVVGCEGVFIGSHRIGLKQNKKYRLAYQAFYAEHEARVDVHQE